MWFHEGYERSTCDYRGSSDKILSRKGKAISRFMSLTMMRYAPCTENHEASDCSLRQHMGHNLLTDGHSALSSLTRIMVYKGHLIRATSATIDFLGIFYGP